MTMVSFEDHVAYADAQLRPVLRELQTRIKALDPSGRRIKERSTAKQRAAFRVDYIFVEVKVKKKQIDIRFFDVGVPDPKNLTENIPETHGWQHEKHISIDSMDQVDYVMKFIEASYRSPRAAKPRR